MAQTISSTDERSIQAFVEKFVVEVFVVKFLKHLELLDLKKWKRAEKRNVQKSINNMSSKRQESSDSETSDDSETSESSNDDIIAEINSSSSELDEELISTYLPMETTYYI